MGRQRRKRDEEQQRAWLFRRHRNANLLAVPGPRQFVIVLDHLKSDFNIGKIFRSADAFGARAVHLVGIESFDPAPAKGSFKWVPARFHVTFRHCYDELRREGYTLFCLQPPDPAAAAASALDALDLPPRSAFVVGNEARGLQFAPDDYPALRRLWIPQIGRVESLNVSVAASIIMYDYVRRYGRGDDRASNLED